MQELYARYGVHFVGGVWYGTESLVSKKPIRTLADFAGVKIRAPVGMGQDIFKRLGAAEARTLGFEPVNWSVDERRKFREEAREVWKAYAGRSEMAKRVYDSQIAFLTKLGLLDR